MNLPSFLSTLKCVLPCAWPVVTLMVMMLVIRWVRTRIIYRGPLPSDGAVDGFASKDDRKEYFDTTDQRTREMFKVFYVFIPLAIVGTGIMFIITKFM